MMIVKTMTELDYSSLAATKCIQYMYQNSVNIRADVVICEELSELTLQSTSKVAISFVFPFLYRRHLRNSWSSRAPVDRLHTNYIYLYMYEMKPRVLNTNNTILWQ